MAFHYGCADFGPRLIFCGKGNFNLNEPIRQAGWNTVWTQRAVGARGAHELLSEGENASTLFAAQAAGLDQPARAGRGT